MNIYYELTTGYCGEDARGVINFPSDYTENDIQDYLEQLAVENAEMYDHEDEDDEFEQEAGCYWREATEDDLDLYEVEQY